MNDKFIVWILAFVFFIAVVWFVSYSGTIDTLNEQLNDARSSLQSAATIVGTRNKALAQKQSDVAKLIAMETQLHEAQKERDPLLKKIDFLSEQPDALNGRILDVVQQIRQKSIGRDFGELRLQSGAVLQNARVQKITDTHVTVSHLGGVARLDAKSAPTHLINLFRLKLETDVTSGKPLPLEKTAGAPSKEKSPQQ